MVCAPADDRETIARLIDDIVVNHHAPTRSELDRLEALLGRLRGMTGDPRVVDLERELLAIARATRDHYDSEERDVFPACLALVRGEADARRFGAVAGTLVEGHEGAARDLPRLLFMVRAIPVPAAGVAIRDDLHDALRALCYDLPLHRHKEERLLLPAARRLAASAA